VIKCTVINSNEDECMKYKKRKLNMIWLLTVVSTMLLGVSLLYNRLIPWQYKLGVFVVAFLYMIVAKRRVKKWLQLILSGVLVILSVFLVYTQSVTDRIFTDFDKDKSLVAFAVLKDSPIQSIEDTVGKTFGYSDSLDQELYVHIVADLRDNHSIAMTAVKKSNDFALLDSLYRQEVDVMIMDKAYWETLEEHDESFASKIRIIHEIEKEVLREEIVKEVNVDRDSFVVYVSGIDVEGPITLRSRSDVNMLMVINPRTGKILTVSMPRDLYVPLACKNNAMDKLTHSGIYGVNCTVQSMEQFLGLDINYYARLNFTSFIQIVDVLGGVDFYNPHTFTSWTHKVQFTAGNVRLNGFEALEYVRERKSFTEGDGMRIQNQQRVIQAIIRKAISPGSLLRIEDILKQVSKSVDTNISGNNIQKLVRLQINKLIDWEFESAVITGSDAFRQTYSVPGRDLYVSLPNMDSVNEARQIIVKFMNEGK